MVRFDKAGELVMLAAARQAELLAGATITLYKNNTDNKGVSYGAHENYLMSRQTPFSAIVSQLTPFFVTRQVVCGAGRVGIGQDGHQHGFQISQRADFFEVEVGLETTLKRPIINTRDEPHADAEKYRRLHVILGDANLAELSTFLKVGTTSLVLAMIEDGWLTDELRIAEPVRELRAVSHDPSLQHLVRLADGRQLTALDVQREYFDRARKYVDDRYGSDLDPQTAQVLNEWDSVLARLGEDPMLLAGELDWVAKLRLLQGYKDRDGLDWSAPRLHAVDLQYADIRPDKGLYHRLVSRGSMRTLVPRRADRRGGRHAAVGHPGLLPRRVPAPLPGRGRRGVLGLGDLRRRPAVAGPGADPGTAAWLQGTRAGAAGPLPDRQVAGRGTARSLSCHRNAAGAHERGLGEPALVERSTSISNRGYESFRCRGSTAPSRARCRHSSPACTSVDVCVGAPFRTVVVLQLDLLQPLRTVRR